MRDESPIRRLPRALPIKALYTVPELQTALGVTRLRMLRLLINAGVVAVDDGRYMYVPIQELQAKLPVIWEAIRVAHRTLRET